MESEDISGSAMSTSMPAILTTSAGTTLAAPRGIKQDVAAPASGRSASDRRNRLEKGAQPNLQTEEGKPK
jgi:hypothetical protein